MGIIKRALKRTSRTLGKIVAPTLYSTQNTLVLNTPIQANDFASPTDGQHHHNHMSQRSMKKLANLQRKFRNKSSSNKDSTVADALLLAVKNHLPPVQFHHVHGPNVHLSSNKRVARRNQSFCQALVFSNRVILPNERVYIKVLEIAKGWSGTIRFGFTAVDPATLAYRMPKHACPDMTNAGHTWARALADEVVRRNSVIHFSYNKNGLIHYGINNQDCGVFHANVNTNQNLWFIVDIYGLTAAVELIDPRANNSSSSSSSSSSSFASGDELDLAQLDDDLPLSHNDRATIFKSTSAMDELFGRYGGDGHSSSRLRKKQSRKLLARQAALMQNNWAFENSIGAAHNFSRLNHNQIYSHLPNLSAVNLPIAQQNIYSPMPTIAGCGVGGQQLVNTRSNNTTNTDAHDYHQIYSHARLGPSVSMANVSTSVATATSAAPTSQRLQATTSNPSTSNSLNNTSANTSSGGISNLSEISQRLGDMTLHSRRTKQHQQKQSAASKSSSGSKTTTAVITNPQTPAVAVNKKLLKQSNSVQTNSKRTSDKTLVNSSRISSTNNKSLASPSSVTQSITATKSSQSGGASNHHHQPTDKLKTRHSIRNPRSSTPTDCGDNNNNPPSKDCPICFERPINCVLYQCGHMCTCYECGVKQWKTQSRTCPICRTIIKDVIKTYMS